MGYYFFSPSTEKGKSARISHKDAGFLFLKNSQSDLDYFEFPTFEPIFSGINLEKGAVLVDFIYDGGGFGGTGFILSEKAMNIIKDFKLPPHRFYALPTYVDKNKTYSYYWMQVLVGDDNYDFIDFENSVFQIDFWEPEPDGRSEEFRFKNAEEMVEAYGEHWMPDNLLYEKEIALTDVFGEKSPDFFQINHVFDTFVISEKLKNAFEENGITGLKDFYENMPRIKGNSAENVAEKPVEALIEKEPFQPKTLEEVTQKLDFIFAEMDQEDDAIYDHEQEIDAALEFLSTTDNPIKPIFAYFEQHPDAIHGAPGPFVHYLETFYGNGLEAELIASAKRNPTSESINMLYRIAKDDSNPGQQKYVDLLIDIAAKHEDEYIAQTAKDCLDDL